MLFLIGSNALGLPNRSFDFSPANSYLSMTNTNFGSYSRTKFAVSYWLRGNGLGGVIMSQYKSGSGNAWTVGASGGVLNGYSYGSGGSNDFVGSTSLSNNTWYHVLWHFDPANSTAANRIKCWLNGVAETDASGVRNSSDINNVSEDIRIGGSIAADNGIAQKFEGYLYQLGFFSGSLPPIAAVYQSGKKDISYETDLYSYIHTNNPNITDDSKLATDWTNNASVALTSTVP